MRTHPDEADDVTMAEVCRDNIIFNW
jgi:hypothetical protein